LYDPFQSAWLSELSPLENKRRITTSLGIVAAFCFSPLLKDVFTRAVENTPEYGVPFAWILVDKFVLDTVNVVMDSALKKTVQAIMKKATKERIQELTKLNPTTGSFLELLADRDGPLQLNLPSLDVSMIKFRPIRKTTLNNIEDGLILDRLTRLQPSELLLVVYEKTNDPLHSPLYIVLNREQLKLHWCGLFENVHPNDPNPLATVRYISVENPKSIPDVYKKCSWCGKNATTAALRLCSGCKVVRYCSAEHQKKDWVGIGHGHPHRAQCKQLRRLTNRQTDWFIDLELYAATVDCKIGVADKAPAFCCEDARWLSE